MDGTKATGGTWFYRLGTNQASGDPATTLAMVAANRRQDGIDVAYWIYSDVDTHGDHEADARLMAASRKMLHALVAVHRNLYLTPSGNSHLDAIRDLVNEAISSAQGGAS